MADFDFGSTLSANGPLYGGSVTYMQPGFPLLLSTGFAKSEVEFDPPTNGDISDALYELAGGFFVKKGLLAGFGYRHSKTEVSQSGLPDRVTERDGYALFTKWVHLLDGQSAFNIEASVETLTFDDTVIEGDNTLIEVLGAYYFNPRVSFGGGLALNTGDDHDDEGIGFRLMTSVFFYPSFSVELGFERFSADNTAGADENTVDVLLSARF